MEKINLPAVDNQKPKIIVILGPTASGKSDLAVKIAKEFNGEIISADSRQVYRGLDIGSGKITKKEMRGVPHHLLDVASPKNIFTVSQYQKLAEKIIKKILKKAPTPKGGRDPDRSVGGKLPIVCGGTGLYIDALIYDYNLPEVPPQIKLRKQLEKKSCEELFKKLEKLDPERAKNIDRYNKRRLVRALEIVIATKKPMPLLNAANSPYNPLFIGIKKSAEELKKRIKLRLLKRLKSGMVEEVKKLRQQDLSWKRLDDLGLEYRYVSRYLRGLISKEEMIETLEKEIFRYAKRQMTWFKKNKDIRWIGNYNEAEKLVGKFLF